MSLWKRICNWFARRSPEYQELERRVLVLSMRAYGIDAPKGTLQRAEGEVLERLMRVVPANIEVMLLPARRSDEIEPGQLGVQLVEGVRR